MDEFVSDIQSDECFESEDYLTDFWFNSYRTYLAQAYGNDTDSSLFYNVLYSQYLPSVYGEQYLDDIWNTIVIKDDSVPLTPQTIGSYSYEYINKSRLTINSGTRGLGTEHVSGCLANWKAIQDEYEDLGVYYWLYITVAAESDLVTVEQTIRSLAYASAAAFVISLILIPYPKMTIFVMTTVGQILFGVLGYMSLWGLPINTTTMINVVLCVGFSIDNAAHFCHAFTTAPIKDIPHKLTTKQERNARVLFALNSVGMPILAGDISTMMALVPLAGSTSEIFVSFTKCISLVMMFGASYAVLYLPVVLSLIGPVGIDDILSEEKEEKLQMENMLNLSQSTNADQKTEQEASQKKNDTEPLEDKAEENKENSEDLEN